MTVALRRGMTLEEFLAWDEGKEGRWEFDGFEPVAMVGGTTAHATIVLNVGAELRARLRGGPCRVFVERLQIRPAGSVRYPDVFVVSGPLQNDDRLAENPVMVFEVLSPSTASTDQIVKLAEYRATPSIQRYVILAQDRIGAVVHERHDATWHSTALTDPAALLDLPEIGATLPLIDCYEGVLPLP